MKAIDSRLWTGRPPHLRVTPPLRIRVRPGHVLVLLSAPFTRGNLYLLLLRSRTTRRLYILCPAAGEVRAARAALARAFSLGRK